MNIRLFGAYLRVSIRKYFYQVTHVLDNITILLLAQDLFGAKEQSSSKRGKKLC